MEERKEREEKAVPDLKQDGRLDEFGDCMEIPCGIRGEEFPIDIFTPAERHTNGDREGMKAAQR